MAHHYSAQPILIHCRHWYKKKSRTVIFETRIFVALWALYYFISNLHLPLSTCFQKKLFFTNSLNLNIWPIFGRKYIWLWKLDTFFSKIDVWFGTNSPLLLSLEALQSEDCSVAWCWAYIWSRFNLLRAREQFPKSTGLGNFWRGNNGREWGGVICLSYHQLEEEEVDWLGSNRILSLLMWNCISAVPFNGKGKHHIKAQMINKTRVKLCCERNQKE